MVPSTHTTSRTFPGFGTLEAHQRIQREPTSLRDTRQERFSAALLLSY